MNKSNEVTLPGEPSEWVHTHAPLMPKTGQILDLACGGGRHTRYLSEQGFSVVAVDKDVSKLGDLAKAPHLEVIETDLENGQDFALKGRQFSGIIVVNYLHRPLFNDLIAALDIGGVLIYQTFMIGNEAYGRPRNPDFLLKENELKDVFGQALTIKAFEQGLIEQPSPAVVQKICAIKN